MITDCLKVLFLKIKSSNELANLDHLAQSLTWLPWQHFASSGSDKSMPHMPWKDGITSLTDLTASYKVGIMFTVVVIPLRDNGRSFFEMMFGHSSILSDMRESFQMMLCYWMWLKKKEFWKCHDQQTMCAVTNAIRGPDQLDKDGISQNSMNSSIFQAKIYRMGLPRGCIVVWWNTTISKW